MEQFTADAEFWIDERADPDGRVCLELVGELDMAGATRLEERLQALAGGGDPVVLDLHRLQFIDSSGLRVLVGAVTDARRDNRALVFEETLSPQVRQIIDLLELRDLFWPPAQ
jgi:anti-anti-sigma factor